MSEGLKYVSFKTSLREDFAARYTYEELGIGFLLALYCAEKLNGGKIEYAKQWEKMEWVLRVHLQDKLSGNCPGLWHWEEDNLIVDCYDVEVENTILAKRQRAIDAAKIRWNNANADANADANAMREQCASNATAYAKTRAHGATLDSYTDNICEADKIPKNKRENLWTYNTVKNNDTITARTYTRDGDGQPLPDFPSWLATLSAALPWLASYRALPEKVEQAAHDAWQSLPRVFNYAELLSAYYKSSLIRDSYKHTFWRPVGAKFFEELVSVLDNAYRWARETGWQSERKAATKKQPAKVPPPSEAEIEEAEQNKKAFLDLLTELRVDNHIGKTPAKTNENTPKNAPEDKSAPDTPKETKTPF